VELDDCRVVRSQEAPSNSGFSTGPTAYSFATSPTTRNCSGVIRPNGVPIRIMK